MLIRCLRCRLSDISMKNNTIQGQRRRPRKRPKKRPPRGNQKILTLSIVAVAIVVIVMFLLALHVVTETQGAVISMLTLAVIFYFITTDQSKTKPRRRRGRSKAKAEIQASEPQFYTALPSSLGLTEIPEEQPRPQIKLPPRPIRAARRRRDFVTYPVAVGGGDYSDSYVQVDKDTVLRLRSEMVPDLGVKYLPGLRIDSLPSSKIAAVMSQETTPSVAPAVLDVTEAVPVVASAEAPVVAEPVVASAEAPVVQSAVVQEEEEEEEEFDMEWD